jgi:hypothetical protein
MNLHHIKFPQLISRFARKLLAGGAQPRYS